MFCLIFQANVLHTGSPKVFSKKINSLRNQPLSPDLFAFRLIWTHRMCPLD